ncbi:MAG: hypothetical protein ACRDLO_10345 [Solirubrobacterales bacterium]
MRACGRVAIPLLVGSLVLAGCGDDEEPATSPATTTPPTTETTTQTATTADGDEAGEADGGGGEEIAIGRPTTIENTLEVVFTGSSDAALICDALVTARYVRSAYGGREGCIAAQKPGALADSVEITEIEEAGDSASAVAIPAGGPYDGVEVEVELVREGGGWRVDSLLADVPAGP